MFVGVRFLNFLLTLLLFAPKEKPRLIRVSALDKASANRSQDEHISQWLEKLKIAAAGIALNSTCLRLTCAKDKAIVTE